MSWDPPSRSIGSDRVERGEVDPPVVALLAPHWDCSGEEGWATRQVAGALACTAAVHVITPDGRRPATSVDGMFTVHELGTPIAALAEARRDLLLDAMAAVGVGRGPGRSVPDELARQLDRGMAPAWCGAVEVITRLRPDRVVIAGHQNVGALDAVDRVSPEIPVTLIALGSSLASLTSPHFTRLFDRSDAVIAMTETERTAVVAEHGGGDRVVRAGVPSSTDPSALSEPNTWVGENDYVLVLTDAESEADDAAVELGRLIRLRFPDNPVGIVATDAFAVWHRGQLSEGWAVERRSDLARLMAWARVTVDLRPGPLVARRCIDSLLYGTPIVVPADARAREHAELGGGGLWFESPSELIGCVGALLDPATHDIFGAQGRAYAEASYGSTDSFIDQVLAATGLAGDGSAVPLTA